MVYLAYDFNLLQLTICLRGIRNAWHFHYALNLVIKVVCGDFGVALAHPLTGR